MARVLSVEIGTSLIKLCEVDYKSKSPKVYKWATIMTPDGVVADDAIIVDEILINALKNVLKDKHMSAKKLVFTMSSTKIASREVTIPYVRENKVGEIVQANATDYFPVDLSQYELGHTILDTFENEKGIKQYKVNVYAAPKSIVESYRELAKALGGSLEALDYSGNSIYQMVKNHCNQGVELVAKVDEVTSIISILNNGRIVLQRTIICGIEGEQENERITLNYLANGISRVVDYYNSRNNDSPIEQAFVIGPGADVEGLDEFLTKALDMKVSILHEPDGFKFEKCFKGENFGAYLTCIGAAMNPVGFLAEKNDRSIKKGLIYGNSDLKNIALIVFAGGVLIAISMALVSAIQLNEARNENKRLNDRINELYSIKDVYYGYLQQEYTTNKLQYFYDSTVVSNEYLVEFIEEMEHKMPQTLNVQSFTANKEGVTMSLTVADKKDAAKLIQQFTTFESVGEIAVSGISDSGAVMPGEPVNEEGKVSFSVSITYKGSEPAEASDTQE